MNTCFSLAFVGVVATFGCTALPGEGTSEAALMETAAPLDATSASAIVRRVLGAFKDTASAHRATFELQPKWESPALNFTPVLKPGRIWALSPHGGLLRFTPDTLTLATCHEIGHFIAGFPFAGTPVQSLNELGSVLSQEGQSDYFATKDCAPRLWKDDASRNATFRAGVDIEAKAKCDAMWPEAGRQNLCYRIMTVSRELLSVIGTGDGISFGRRDSSVVKATNAGYPSPQGRLDTFVAGALCARVNGTTIPGLVASPAGYFGQQSVAAERNANDYACLGDDRGARPLSWFKPDMPDALNVDCSSFGGGSAQRCEGKTLVSCTRTEGITSFECGESCGKTADGFYDCL